MITFNVSGLHIAHMTQRLSEWMFFNYKIYIVYEKTTQIKTLGD